MEKHGLTFVQDLEWISCKGKRIPLEVFAEIAHRTDYDPGFGTNYIDTSLRLKFKKGVLYWTEYDGAEGWEYMDLTYPEEVMDNPTVSLEY